MFRLIRISRSGVHKKMVIEMAGYGVSNVQICARMRELGIPDTLARARLGRTWSFYDPCRRGEIVFFLNHGDRVSGRLWQRMSQEQQQQFPRHQWPKESDND